MAEFTDSSRTSVQLEYRVLSGLCMGKPVKMASTFDNELLSDNMNKVLSIFQTLVQHPDRIQRVQVALNSTDALASRSKKKDDDAESSLPAFYSGKVTKIMLYLGLSPEACESESLQGSFVLFGFLAHFCHGLYFNTRLCNRPRTPSMLNHKGFASSVGIRGWVLSASLI